MRSELEETSHARSQLERLSVHLADENRQLKNKLEIQNQELSSATSELKHRFLKLDDDTRHIVSWVFVFNVIYIFTVIDLLNEPFHLGENPHFF